MPSPFPGMNPYLEHPAVWQDFHDTFLPTIREHLVPQVLPLGFYARIAEHLYVRDAWAEEETLVGKADLAVRRTDGPTASGATAVAVAPVAVELPPSVDIERMPYLEVVNPAGYEVVTVIELLSPSNKRGGRDRDQYEAKRRHLFAADVNFVEIDLLRGGRSMPAVGLPACDYRVLVSRAADRPRAGMWPLSLRDPLPTIPIPLRPGLPEPTVPLQALLHRVYDAAGYATIIYRQPPDPPLTGADAEWAAALVPAAG